MRVKIHRDVVSRSRKLHLSKHEMQILQQAVIIVERMRDYVENESDTDYMLAGGEHGLRDVIREVPLVLSCDIVMPRL